MDWFLDRARALGVEHAPPPPLVLGRHLVALGVAPGPGMGEILRAVYEQQLDGTVTTLAEAQSAARLVVGHLARGASLRRPRPSVRVGAVPRTARAPFTMPTRRTASHRDVRPGPPAQDSAGDTRAWHRRAHDCAGDARRSHAAIALRAGAREALPSSDNSGMRTPGGIIARTCSVVEHHNPRDGTPLGLCVRQMEAAPQVVRNRSTRQWFRDAGVVHAVTRYTAAKSGHGACPMRQRVALRPRVLCELGRCCVALASARRGPLANPVITAPWWPPPRRAALESPRSPSHNPRHGRTCAFGEPPPPSRGQPTRRVRGTRPT